VRGPRRPRAWSASMALLCAACTRTEPAAPPPPLAPIWTLAGEVALGEVRPSSRPGFEDGSALLGPTCRTASERLGDRPPPCRAELWRPLRPAGEAPGQERTLLLQVGATFLLQTPLGETVRSTTWSALGSILAGCLQDPFALPPAGDPGAFRHLLLGAQGTAWVLHLSGENPCRLSGEVRLGILPDGVSVEDLMADGLPWRAGGAERALALWRAAARVEVRDHFLELPTEERILGLEALVHDPDPEALTVLQQLATSGGPGSLDAARAIERRAHQRQEPP